MQNHRNVTTSRFIVYFLLENIMCTPIFCYSGIYISSYVELVNVGTVYRKIGVDVT